MKEKKAILGILTQFKQEGDPPFLEKDFFKILSLSARPLGLHVIVFSPYSIDWQKRKVYGYTFHARMKQWRTCQAPFPRLVYDRLFYVDKNNYYALYPWVKRLREIPGILWLNRGLPGKWPVYNALKAYPQIRPYLPETSLFSPDGDWPELLFRKGALFLKPSLGSQGKGVLKISLAKGRKEITVIGRDPRFPQEGDRLISRSFASVEPCRRWLRTFVGSKSYVIQPYLSLRTKDGLPFDLRILVQKDGHGLWRRTGQAIRLGPKRGLTANLHGGGKAVEASSFLQTHYSPRQVELINHAVDDLTFHLPVLLEKKYSPLCELGLDVGVDQEGKVWLLEVNSKPGRQSFQECGDWESFLTALTRPVHYACFLLNNGRSITYA